MTWDHCSTVLNQGTEEELSCKGYRESAFSSVLYWTLVLFSGGLLLLLFYWKPAWRVVVTMVPCPLDECTVVLLEDSYHQKFVEPIKTAILSQTSDTDLAESESQHVANSCNDNDLEEGSDKAQLLPSAHKQDIGSGLSQSYFDYCFIRYIFDGDTFAQLQGYEVGHTFQDLHSAHGLKEREYDDKAQLYGKNTIDVEVKSYAKLFFEEVLNPFYIFQIASITLWSLDDYYYYAACIFLISLISIAVSLYETKKQAVSLHNMVKMPDETIGYFDGNNKILQKSTCDLVPGDVIVLPRKGCMMQCDAALLTGTCIVNESMLTGESVPVTKTAIPASEAAQVYSPEKDKRSTLFSGTQIIQTRYYGDAEVKAVVIRTGFNTAKGDLVRSILFPKPLGFKFYKDSIKFIMVLFCIAMVGMAYTLITMIKQQLHWSSILKRALDIITVVVPPALPAAMTVGTVYAQSRLKKKGIFCISPPRINICGKLKLICFDKTGTLTEDGLDMWGVMPVDKNWFCHVNHDPSTLAPDEKFVMGMASCHSLTIIGGEMIGDPLDLKMFNSTNWILEEPGEDTSRFDNLMPTIVKPPSSALPAETSIQVGIVRQFTFTSDLQRMSVITRTLGESHMEIFCKGAPEKIQQLCVPASVPSNFPEVLQEYTMRGFRVIALAYRTLPGLTWHQAQRTPRDDMERDLSFLGLLIMQNTLKRETTPIITKLKEADIRTVMITGDNVLTAVSVARECRMVRKHEKIIIIKAIPPKGPDPAKLEWEYSEGAATAEDGDTTDTDGPCSYDALTESNSLMANTNYHYAIVGKSYAVLRQYFPDIMDYLHVKGVVFARMAPDQKAQVVEALQDLGYGVGMCGDGANDCGALKVAHAGISLSEAEASVASPFTSRVPNISCVPEIIKEGRAALTTSFGVFNYMALYSLIQFFTVLILYTVYSNLTDTQFLYIDLAITTSVAVFMSYARSYEKLVKRRPLGSLVSLINMCSIFSQVILVAAFQLAALFYLRSQSWFVPAKLDPSSGEQSTVTYETTTLFLLTSFQYLTLSVSYSKGPPYRQPLYKNKPFLVSLIILTACSYFLLFYEPQFLINFFQLKPLNGHIAFQSIIALMAAIHFLVSYIIETFILESDSARKFSRFVRRKRVPKNRYKVVERDLAHTPWPSARYCNLTRDDGESGAEG